MSEMYGFEIILRMKKIPTILAFKYLTCVYDFARSELRFIFKKIPILLAFKIFSMRRTGHVNFEASFPEEFSFAVLAFEFLKSILSGVMS